VSPTVIQTYPRPGDCGFLPAEQVEFSETIVKSKQDFGDQVVQNTLALKYTLDDQGEETPLLHRQLVHRMELQPGNGQRLWEVYHTGDLLGWQQTDDGRVASRAVYREWPGFRQRQVMDSAGLRAIAKVLRGEFSSHPIKFLVIITWINAIGRAIDRLVSALWVWTV
jgi:hypothetical protein